MGRRAALRRSERGPGVHAMNKFDWFRTVVRPDSCWKRAMPRACGPRGPIARSARCDFPRFLNKGSPTANRELRSQPGARRWPAATNRPNRPTILSNSRRSRVGGREERILIAAIHVGQVLRTSSGGSDVAWPRRTAGTEFAATIKTLVGPAHSAATVALPGDSAVSRLFPSPGAQTCTVHCFCRSLRDA